MHWLHQDTTMYQVQEKYLKKHPMCEWKFELRIRYVPTDLLDMHERDIVTFVYYYDQVKIILKTVLRGFLFYSN